MAKQSCHVKTQVPCFHVKFPSPLKIHHSQLSCGPCFDIIFMLLFLLCSSSTHSNFLVRTIACKLKFHFIFHVVNLSYTGFHPRLCRWQNKYLKMSGASKAEGRENVSRLRGIKLLFQKLLKCTYFFLIWLEISSAKMYHLHSSWFFLLSFY